MCVSLSRSLPRLFAHRRGRDGSRRILGAGIAEVAVAIGATATVATTAGVEVGMNHTGSYAGRSSSHTSSGGEESFRKTNKSGQRNGKKRVLNRNTEIALALYREAAGSGSGRVLALLVCGH